VTDPFFDSPILNSPYERPGRHWELDETGQPTNRIASGRRGSSYATPVPKPKKKGPTGQLALTAPAKGGYITDEGVTIDPIPIINKVRQQVDDWRRLPASQWRVTPQTSRLLSHWRTSPLANRRPFFCQVEAVETAIWLTEVARKNGVNFIPDYLDAANRRGDPGRPDLARLALKLATGTGKTTVMAMLIAWQTVNAVRHPQRHAFTRGFLVVTPGITIRDRLRVLRPDDPYNYYERHALVPADMLGDIKRAEVVLTNYHALQRREISEVPKGGRALLHGRTAPPDTRETEGAMLQRVCPGLLGMKRVIVFNDEAHHCYRERPPDPEAGETRLTGDDRKEAQRSKEAARLWISGIESLARKVRVQRVFDLSATPFFLAGSGYPEGVLFPWTMSDFSLLDAIECGIVKLPRVPVADNIPQAETPRYRNLWKHIGKAMPRGRRQKDKTEAPANLPTLLQNALDALYRHYDQTFWAWQEAGIQEPPCFIVVCNNTRTSKLVHDYIAGYKDGSDTFHRGRLPLFCNFDDRGEPLPLPHTVLIDSVQIESGEGLDDSFLEAAASEIEQYRRERVQHSGNPADHDISPQDLLREVMNTVGKPGRLGASVRCVVSVAMLTEGWDANTVTHILGVRAFGTQLLCEQVTGRALRRQSYELNDEGKFEVEYADVLGVPFDFTAKPQVVAPPKPAERVPVHAVSPERDTLEIRFPRVTGYRFELPECQLDALFDDNSTLELTPELVGPTRTRNEGLIGEGTTLSPENPDLSRPATLVYHLARHLLERHWPAPIDQPDCFADLHAIVARWLKKCLVCKGGTTFRQLAWHSLADMACEKIMQGIEVRHAKGLALAVLDPPEGTTASVNFTTTRSKTLWETHADKCHVNYAVCDSQWEAEFCRVVEAHPGTLAYVKNHGLGFEVPYCFGGSAHRYVPDFIVKVLDRDDPDDPMHLVVEIKGQRTEQDKAKAAEMNVRWIPAVNRDGRFGRWAFAEFTDIDELDSDYKSKVRALCASGTAEAAEGFKESLVTGPSSDDPDLARPEFPPRKLDFP